MDEFDLINNLKKKLGFSAIGDDCAVIPQNAAADLLITADLLVEGIDFETNWISAGDIGRKALAVSLSDIAAMGGEPKWAMTSIGVPEAQWRSGFATTFYEGWNECAKEFGVELIGGDISRSPSGFFVDSIVGGYVPNGKAILRSGARPGDSLYVTGPLGTAAAGLMLLKRSLNIQITGTEALLDKQLRPYPQIELGKQLREMGIATAMIDLSDGLSSDLRHVCSASGVGAVVFADELPFESVALEVAGSADKMLDLALNGGEDLELLFSADETRIPAELPVFKIGEITANAGVIEIQRGDSRELLLAKGFKHF